MCVYINMCILELDSSFHTLFLPTPSSVVKCFPIFGVLFLSWVGVGVGSVVLCWCVCVCVCVTYGSVKTRRWECDRSGVEPTSSGCIVWGHYHSSEKVSCDEWYWNPSPDISGYMCGARRVVRSLLLTTASFFYRQVTQAGELRSITISSFRGSTPNLRGITALDWRDPSHLYIYIYTHAHTHTYIHIYTYIYIYTYVYICIHTHIYIYTYRYIYIYIFTYIHK